MTDERPPAAERYRDDAELFRYIVESAEDFAIFTTDAGRRVTSWNTGSVRVMGWTEAEIVGQSADVIFTPEDREKGDPEKEARKAVAEGRAMNKRWHMRKDGSRFWGDGFMFPLRDDAGHMRGFVKIFRDRTADLRAEEARREADRRKDEFLAMLAHELRNPLAAIGNASQLSLQPGADPETIDWTKGVIARQVKNLSHMIDDLLDISRINRGKVQLKKEPVHVGPVIARAVEAVSHLIDEKRHELKVSVATGPMRVNADPTRLEQIVTNLITNAAKYTDPGGSISVTAYPERGRVAIKVKDNGIGLPPEMLTEIFELFSQVDKSLDRGRGGLGIGLTVVKRLVEMHGGSVRASSEGLGKGSEFAVEIPLLESTELRDGGGNARRGRTGTTSRRILVVDDSVDTAIGMARLLRLSGHEVDIAHEGHAAVEVALSFRPEILILDLGLPGLSGYEVASRLRGEEHCKEAVLIAVSGYGQQQDRELSRAAGIDQHFAKPVDFESLLALISPTTR
jgi:PAS domain S-box-containing protein